MVLDIRQKTVIGCCARVHSRILFSHERRSVLDPTAAGLTGTCRARHTDGQGRFQGGLSRRSLPIAVPLNISFAKQKYTWSTSATLRYGNLPAQGAGATSWTLPSQRVFTTSSISLCGCFPQASPSCLAVSGKFCRKTVNFRSRYLAATLLLLDHHEIPRKRRSCCSTVFHELSNIPIEPL